MKGEGDRTLATVLVLFLLLFWLGFIVHASPRFPGSLAGSMLGIAGAALIVLPSLAITLGKRVRFLKPIIPIRQTLSVHIYTSFLGALLVFLHSAHKFDSPLGMALMAMTLLAVLSGYVGRYFMAYINAELRDKQTTLASLHRAGESSEHDPAGLRHLAVAAVDLEYSIATHDLMKGRASTWLRIHRYIAIAFLVLLGLHVTAGIYFGLRWW